MFVSVFSISRDGHGKFSAAFERPCTHACLTATELRPAIVLLLYRINSIEMESISGGCQIAGRRRLVIVVEGGVRC